MAHAAPRPSRRTPHRSCPTGSSTYGPSNKYPIAAHLARIMSHNGFHLLPKRQASQSVPPPISSNSSHVWCPSGISTYGPRDKCHIASLPPMSANPREAPPRPLQEGPHGVPSPISPRPSHGSCHTRRVRMASSCSFRNTPHTDRALPEAPLTAPVTVFASGPAPNSAYPSRRSCPTRVLHPRPQRARSHAGLRQIQHTPQAVRAPQVIHCCLSGRARMRVSPSRQTTKQITPHKRFSAPLPARSAAPYPH